MSVKSGSAAAIMVALLIVITCFPAQAIPVRVKNLVKIQGASSNQLIGYGLVVGLSGTGDRNKGITDQAVANMLKAFGSSLNSANLRTQNAAAVMVTAELPPFAKSGDRVDATVSSLGDATGLQGGTLLLTALRGVDGKTYAMAQGPLSIGGFNVETGAAGGARQGVQKNHAAAGRLPSGVLIHADMTSPLVEDGAVSLVLNSPDFVTAARLSNAVNMAFGPVADARDAATVSVRVPPQFSGRSVDFIAQIGQLSVEPDEVARVVINERTGTVIMGSDVKIGNVAIAHGNLKVVISSETKVVAPKYPYGPTETVPKAEVTPREEERRLLYLPGGASLRDVVDALNAVGVSPRDLISILQGLRQAGAPRAELEIL
ncbi:MAG: flagellar basal body P-ring protein FlgI [Armatimonadetes bacterium]|nr:flagellar basal body P-ring protein FlgI [Armatimonadota bacterium]